MKIVSLCTGLSLSLCLALTVGSGCASDDKKVALRDGDAGGQGGEGLGGEGPSSGGSQGSGASSTTSPGGAAGEAGTESAGGSSAGGNNAGGTGEGGSNGNEAGAPPSGGSTGSGEAGAGGVGTSETPVPSACIGCASDFCVAARVACQNDAACVSCRDDDYTTLACAQNAAFTNWIACICAAGCTAACPTLCGA